MVHVEGDDPYSFIVNVTSFDDDVTVYDVALQALNRYNKIFHKNLKPSEISISTMDEMDGELMPEIFPDEVVITSVMEIFIFTPMIIESDNKFPSPGEDGFDSLNVSYPIIPANSILSIYELYRQEPKPTKSYEELVKYFNFHSHKLTESQKYRYLKQISKTNPTTAIKLMFRHMENYILVSRIARGKNFRHLIDELKRMKIKCESDFLSLFQNFYMLGCVDEAAQLILQMEPITKLDPFNILTVLLIYFKDRQFSRYYTLLLAFLKLNNCRNKCTKINFDQLFKLFNNLKQCPSQPVRAPSNAKNNSIESEIDGPATHSVLRILFLSSVFVFINGEMSTFDFLVSLLKPYCFAFEANDRHQYQEYELFMNARGARSRMKNGTIDFTKTIFVIGDENAVLPGFQNIRKFGYLIPHPIPTLSITALRKGLKSPERSFFWNVIKKEVKNYEGIMLVLGTNDILKVSPSWMQNDPKVTFFQVFRSLGAIYEYTIKRIRKYNPNIAIYVHPSFVRRNFSEYILEDLNDYLENRLNDVFVLNFNVDYELMCLSESVSNYEIEPMDYPQFLKDGFAKLQKANSPSK